MKSYLRRINIRHGLSVLLVVLSVLTIGCSSNQYPPQMAQPDGSANYSRVEIDQNEIANTLRRALEEMSETHGSFDPEPIINDYIVLIRQGLYHNGFCRVTRLTINNETVDIETYFSVAEMPAALHVNIYTNGQYQPSFTAVSHYAVAAM